MWGCVLGRVKDGFRIYFSSSVFLKRIPRIKVFIFKVTQAVCVNFEPLESTVDVSKTAAPVCFSPLPFHLGRHVEEIVDLK